MLGSILHCPHSTLIPFSGKWYYTQRVVIVEPNNFRQNTSFDQSLATCNFIRFTLGIAQWI